MARGAATILLEWSGIDECVASLQSIGEAVHNACVDNIDIAGTSEGFVSMGMTIARIDISLAGLRAVARVAPTASMILFVGAVMARLPSTARVTWRDGWPRIHCPPNDDRDGEDNPTPFAPNELEPA